MDKIDRAVTKEVGEPVDTIKLVEARKRAEGKLASIINRFGDADGKRKEEWYLVCLISEELRSMSMEEITNVLFQFENTDFRDKKMTAVLAQQQPQDITRIS